MKAGLVHNETMSDPNEPVEPGDDRAGQTPASAPQNTQGLDLKRRLRELLSIPESQRSDPVWDEIIELEIQLAPGNRIGGGPPPRLGPGGAPKGGGGGSPGGGGANWKRHGPRKHPKAGGGGGGKKPPQGNQGG